MTPLGALPLIVDNAPLARDGLGLTGTHATTIAAAWDAGQQRFSWLSSAGVYRVVSGGHYVHQDQLPLVLDQVRSLVAKAP